MKRITGMVILMVIIFSNAPLSKILAQRTPIPFSSTIIKSLDDQFGFKNLPATIQIKLKDKSITNVVYEETQEVTLNNLAFFTIQIGRGTSQSFLFDTAHLDELYLICYTAVVHAPSGDVTIMGEDFIGAVPNALFSENAENAEALGNNKWVVDTIHPPFEVMDLENISIPVVKYDEVFAASYFNLLNAKGYFGKATAPSAVNQTELPYYQVGSGEGTPIVFGRTPVPELEGFETRCYMSDENLFNGSVFKFLQGNQPPLTHSTAAVYAENIYDPLGVGMFANGASRGSYNQGQTGMLGLTVGVNNGAASWSRVAVAPTAGGYKYGVFAEDQGLSDSWAAAIFGRGFYTGTWSQSSDARLKKEIRAQSDGLDQVMKLKPSQYLYIENTPYSLPDGIHHGFIAQEMEEVFPELVSNVNMPTSMDKDNLIMNGTSTYKAINYIELIPILTSAIQEMNTDLQELKARLEAQAAEIGQLRAEINKINKPK
jgi:hypothetical protein